MVTAAIAKKSTIRGRLSSAPSLLPEASTSRPQPDEPDAACVKLSSSFQRRIVVEELKFFFLEEFEITEVAFFKGAQHGQYALE
jgi:hypothetical protein